MCRAALRISIATLLICRAALRISIATLLICRAALRIAMALKYICLIVPFGGGLDWKYYSESWIFTILGDLYEILGIIREEGGTCLNIRESPEWFGRVGNTGFSITVCSKETSISVGGHQHSCGNWFLLVPCLPRFHRIADMSLDFPGTTACATRGHQSAW